MKISMYAMSAESFLPMLRNLSQLLQKAATHAEAKKIDASVLPAARLAPDMFPLVKQVQLVSDFAKSGTARLAGLEPPKFEDNEQTLADLQARVKRTIEFVGSVGAGALEGSEEREISIPLRDQTLKMKGLEYLKGWVLPNFYFHLTTVYAILRHNGVEIGKRDFLGS